MTNEIIEQNQTKEFKRREAELIKQVKAERLEIQRLNAIAEKEAAEALQNLETINK